MLETKFANFELKARDAQVEGYASLFGIADQSGDVVEQGAYGRALASGRSVKMLWQHDMTKPIGVWEEIREDALGLYVKGRLLTELQSGREAAVLLQHGAVDGLSIGYRTVRSTKSGSGRLLTELDLWEVSLVTFPMLPEARVKPADDTAELARTLAEAFAEARSLV